MYQPPPPQRPPLLHQRFIAWYRRTWQRNRLLTGCLTLLSVFLLCTCGLCGLSANPAWYSPSRTPLVVQSTPTVTPTHKPATRARPTPTPTATPDPFVATNGRPAYNGPLSDFVGNYGKPDEIKGLYKFYTGNITIGANITATKTVNRLSVTNLDNWTASEARAYCETFLPDDAVLYNSIENVTNPLYNYHSASAKDIVLMLPGGSGCLMYPK